MFLFKGKFQNSSSGGFKRILDILYVYGCWKERMLEIK